MKQRIAAFKVQLRKAYWQGHANGEAKGKVEKGKSPLDFFGGYGK